MRAEGWAMTMIGVALGWVVVALVAPGFHWWWWLMASLWFLVFVGWLIQGPVRKQY